MTGISVDFVLDRFLGNLDFGILLSLKIDFQKYLYYVDYEITEKSAMFPKGESEVITQRLLADNYDSVPQQDKVEEKVVSISNRVLNLVELMHSGEFPTQLSDQPR